MVGPHAFGMLARAHQTMTVPAMRPDGRDVQLELGGETIHGTLSASDHPLINFTGWLELMSAFEGLRG